MRADRWTGPPILLVPLIMTAAATSTLAAEFQKPVTRWTCSEFLSVEDQFKQTVVYWAMVYAKGRQPEAARDRYQGHRERDLADHRRMHQGATGLILAEAERRMEEGRGR